jgi:hypothetical protein
MRHAQELLGLGRLSVVHAGDTSFELGRGITAIGASRLLDDIAMAMKIGR